MTTAAWQPIGSATVALVPDRHTVFNFDLISCNAVRCSSCRARAVCTPELHFNAHHVKNSVVLEDCVCIVNSTGPSGALVARLHRALQ